MYNFNRIFVLLFIVLLIPNLFKAHTRELQIKVMSGGQPMATQVYLYKVTENYLGTKFLSDPVVGQSKPGPYWYWTAPDCNVAADVHPNLEANDGTTTINPTWPKIDPGCRYFIRIGDYYCDLFINDLPGGIDYDPKLYADFLITFENNTHSFELVDNRRGILWYQSHQWTENTITVKNSFGGVNIIFDGTASYNIPADGISFVREARTFPHYVRAIDGQTYSNYVRRFTNFTGLSGSDDGLTRTIIQPSTGTVEAVFRKEYNIVFQNPNHNMTINNIDYYSTGTVQIVQDESVNAIGQNYSANNIGFTFDSWKRSDGIAFPSTFTPTDHGTYYAVYRAKPSNNGENPHVASSFGQPITIAWTDNPDTNVNQYQIWRTVKHDGVVGPAVLLATVNRGTQTYTDYEYQRTSTYVDLLNYDVRSYYNSTNPYVIGEYADEYWFAAYGQMLARMNQDQLFQEVALEIPSVYSISNYPNPFNPTTTIRYQLPETGMVSIKVYDILGKEVAELVNETKAAGYYEVVFDASELTSGIYIYTIQVNNFIESKKIILVK